MNKKTSGESAKSPDEMGYFREEELEIVMTEEQMMRMMMLPKDQRDMFWHLLDSHLMRREYFDRAAMYALLWDILAGSIKRQRERIAQEK